MGWSVFDEHGCIFHHKDFIWNLHRLAEFVSALQCSDRPSTYIHCNEVQLHCRCVSLVELSEGVRCNEARVG